MKFRDDPLFRVDVFVELSRFWLGALKSFFDLRRSDLPNMFTPVALSVACEWPVSFALAFLILT